MLLRANCQCACLTPQVETFIGHGQAPTLAPAATPDPAETACHTFQQSSQLFSTMRMQRTQCAQWMLWYRLVLFAWTAVLIAGGAVAWKFISKRGFQLPAIPGSQYDKEEQSYLGFFGDGVDGAQAALVLGSDSPVMAMTNVSTCQIKPALQQVGSTGNTFQLELSCQNESAPGGGCITSSQLRSEVHSLVSMFMSNMMSPENLSHFLELQVEPMLDAAPEMLACPHVEDTFQKHLAEASFQVEESLRQKMPNCDLAVLSFWSLPPQQFQRNLTFAEFKFEVTVTLPAGSFWNVFQKLLSSKSQEQVMVAVRAHTCNGLPVADFSQEALQVANILKDVAEAAEGIDGTNLKAEVMSFAIIVKSIRDGVEVVMAMSTGTLPLGIAVLAYMVGNPRLVIIAIINVLAAVTGSVLLMECLVTHLMQVSIFTPPFLIAVVLSMSIDYALFLLSRFQKETAAGAAAAEAMAISLSTSGRIVAQAGVILACCFACLLMTPVQLVSAMGAGGLVAVAVAMAANLTLTPALILGTRPTFWIGKPNAPCRQAEGDAEAPAGDEELHVPNVSMGFWRRFGERLTSCAKPLLFLILLSAAPCVWKDLMPSSDMLGFTPALPQGSSTAKIFHSIGEEFGYEVLFPTTIGLVAPPEVNLEEWRLQACKALQEIGEEVYRSDFTSSTFMSEVIIDGKCLAVDVAGSLLKWWQTNGQEGTVVYIDYPLNPLSIDGQRWTKSLQRAVEDHHRGRWYVHGYGPLLSSQSGEIREFFPYLVVATVCAVLLISMCFTRSVLWSLRALLCLFWMLAVLWCLSSLVFPEGLYFIVPSMMLPFLVGVALDYDIFYTEAVLEECNGGLPVKKAGIKALEKTANIITAAGVVMIIAFCPLLLSSTLVLKQIGFMAIGGLSISAFWNTKVAMPVCLHFFGKHSFWPRNLEKKQRCQQPIDAIFLGHPAYLVDTFTWLTSPDTEKPWSASWWMYLFLPVLWLLGFVGAHILRRLGLPNHVVLDDYEYNGLHVQTWVVLHYGRHFRNSLELHDARRNVRAAASRAEKTGARVLGLGALNKAESLNRGGLDLVQHLPSSRSMCVTHGDHLTAAAVVENVLRLVARFPELREKIFMTGATGKTGKAVALALLRRGVSVMCHSGSKQRRDELETHGLATASHLRDGADCGMWIVGKCDQLVNQVMPPSAVACVFAVPNPVDPVSRSDVMVYAGATMQIDESRLKGQRANLKLLRQEIYACNAATLLLASGSKQFDDLGEVDPLTLEAYLEGAESIGITLKPLDDFA